MECPIFFLWSNTFILVSIATWNLQCVDDAVPESVCSTSSMQRWRVKNPRRWEEGFIERGLHKVLLISSSSIHHKDFKTLCHHIPVLKMSISWIFFYYYYLQWFSDYSFCPNLTNNFIKTVILPVKFA